MLRGHLLHPEIVFRDFVYRWVGLIAEGRAAEAMALLDEPNSYGVLWGPEQLQEALRNYGAAGRCVSVTPPQHAKGQPHSSLIAFADQSGYCYNHDLPLNGAWSDLEAQFAFLKRKDGYAILLHDVHVS